MFDSRLRPLIDPPLAVAASALLRAGISANAMSWMGLALAAVATGAIVGGAFSVALAAILLNRLADGIDGAIARQSGATDLGGYYDIVFDFLFYGAVPLGFAIYDPAQNALPAAVLLASFYANGATFLAFAAIAAGRGMTTTVQGKKTIYYFTGIAEGAETIGVFCAMALLPTAFAWLAYGFAAICALSAVTRIAAVRDRLRETGRAANAGQGEPITVAAGKTS